MIDILQYREILAELREKVNQKSEEQIEGIVMAVREGHMVKKLKDRTGIQLCANYPDAQMNGTFDNHSDRNKVLIFLLEKVPSGQQTDEAELQHYARIQRMMRILRDALLENDAFCGELRSGDDLLTEWEYDICGGWNGLSIGLDIEDFD